MQIGTELINEIALDWFVCAGAARALAVQSQARRGACALHTLLPLIGSHVELQTYVDDLLQQYCVGNLGSPSGKTFHIVNIGYAVSTFYVRLRYVLVTVQSGIMMR